MDNLISVIIPIYNVEKYVDRCIESVVNQIYKNLEIILVDDGSPDSCPQICDKWAEKDERIIVIHKQNGGVSTARNAGLDIAKGDYIGFVDGDDYLEPEFYETMLNALLSNDADIVMCEAKYAKVSEWPEYLSFPGHKSAIIDKTDYLEMICRGYSVIFIALWNRLYKRECVEGLRFDEGMIFAEDRLFNFFAAEKANGIYQLGLPLYNFVENFGSAGHTKYNSSRKDEYKALNTIIEKFGQRKEIYDAAIDGLVHAAIFNIVKMCEASSYDDFEESRKIILKYKDHSLKSTSFSKIKKIKVVMICYFPSLFKIYAKLRKFRYVVKDRILMLNLLRR